MCDERVWCDLGCFPGMKLPGLVFVTVAGDSDLVMVM